jgi:hypothetical protein
MHRHWFPSCRQLRANNQDSGLKKYTKQTYKDGTNTQHQNNKI